jgi:hypothetical protein
MPKHSETPLKAISEDEPGQTLSRFEKRCGRCGIPMKKNHFCSACRKFFHLLGRKSIFTTS